MRNISLRLATILVLVAGSAMAAPATRSTLESAGSGAAKPERQLVQMGRGMMGPGYGYETPPAGGSPGGGGYGARVYASQCSMCHSVQPGGAGRVGPSLYGVIGRRAGSLPGYDYSAAMRQAGQSGIVWNAHTLNAFLANPQRDIPGDRMPFSGIANQAERQAVIAYLAQAAR